MDSERIFSFVERDAAPAVLATIISVQGHAYRKEGASMIFTEDGKRLGSISPGCLEADLQLRVPRILAAGNFEVAEYNLSPEEDAVWGEEIGCGGSLRVLMEPLSGILSGMFIEIGRRVRGGESIRLIRRVSGGRLRYFMETVYPRRGRADRAMDDDLLFASVFMPQDRLIIFGAGGEAKEIDALVQHIGFRTAIADWRDELCSPQRFPYAEIAVGDAESIVKQLGIGERDYVIIGSHHLRRDKEMFARVIPLRPAYVGIVGSAKRIRLLMEGASMPSFVKAPVGVPIEAEGPREIAVSVAAELIAWRKQLEAQLQVQAQEQAQVYRSDRRNA